MYSIKVLARKILPYRVLSVYHLIIAFLSALLYGYPSNDLIVIGVTGTKGKTSTSMCIFNALKAAGCSVGLISGIAFKINGINIKKSGSTTMPGRGMIQKLLHRMKKEKCRFVVVEVTSHGISQHRHFGVYFDCLVFTNLSKEHLELHNDSYEDYRNAKLRIFSGSSINKKKMIEGKNVPKYILVNKDEKDAKYFEDVSKESGIIKLITFGASENADVRIIDLSSPDSFKIEGIEYKSSTPGSFTKYNMAPAHIISNLYENRRADSVVRAIEQTYIEGRMDEVKSDKIDFRIFIDYAHEERSLTEVIKSCRDMTKGKVIAVVGGVGGGRDQRNIEATGEVAGKFADIVVVTNVDPYEMDEQVLADRVAESSEKEGKKRGRDLFVIVDRATAVKKAIGLASKEDIVLLTGKGHETVIIKSDGSVPYNDREAVEAILSQNDSCG